MCFSFVITVDVCDCLTHFNVFLLSLPFLISLTSLCHYATCNCLVSVVLHVLSMSLCNMCECLYGQL